MMHVKGLQEFYAAPLAFHERVSIQHAIVKLATGNRFVANKAEDDSSLVCQSTKRKLKEKTVTKMTYYCTLIGGVNIANIGSR